ncbi:hypothetical protein, partial [Vibrio sp. 2-2(9)]|uniref:hypothetical protein n=1 Tax=Vibrio sp. 2-2(9) TaxID=2591015 RepID=UPI00201813A9
MQVFGEFKKDWLRLVGARNFDIKRFTFSIEIFKRREAAVFVFCISIAYRTFFFLSFGFSQHHTC